MVWETVHGDKQRVLGKFSPLSPDVNEFLLISMLTGHAVSPWGESKFWIEGNIIRIQMLQMDHSLRDKQKILPLTILSLCLSADFSGCHRDKPGKLLLQFIFALGDLLGGAGNWKEPTPSPVRGGQEATLQGRQRGRHGTCKDSTWAHLPQEVFLQGGHQAVCLQLS